MAAQGTRVALVARREDALNQLATTIGPNALVFAHDVTNAAEVPELFQKICQELGGLDVIVYSSGVMPHLGTDEYTYSKDANMIEVNCLGAVAWLNEAAQRFGQTKSGTIVGISSVAGDRGRAGLWRDQGVF
jgi:decaprenylphospho-beta-D-erythro-pentofuranosid-2-ulose 2-reductase